MNLVFRSRAAWYYHDLITYFVEFPLGDFTAKFVVSRAVLSSENTVFPRTSAYCRSEKKNGVGRGKLANKFFMGNIKGPRTPGG